MPIFIVPLFQKSVNQCMFWCMFASDATAISCDILQNRSGEHVFYYVYVMRIRALTCSLLQHSKIWTQNPSIARSWGFAPPSRHQQNKEFKREWPLLRRWPLLLG